MPERTSSMSYQLFMLVLCIYTLAALAIEAMLKPQGEIRQLMDVTDTAICILFFADFWVSLWNAPNRWRYFYTWGWLDLLSSIPTFDVARWGRLARVARVLRVMRALRATRIVGGLLIEQRARSGALGAALAAILMVMVASISILHVETEAASNITTAEDAVWWAMTTMTTVGYGDRVPVTTEGRVIAALLMVGGVGLFGTFSGLLAAFFVGPNKDETSELAALRREIAEIKNMMATVAERRE